MNHQFPKDFVWGVATSAAQIEGAVNVGGRGKSVWDAFASNPVNIDGGASPEIAADHYHRMEEDVDLLKHLGVQAYRFSISWSRIFPEGSGKLNQEGLDFYQRLVDKLLAEGIQPWVTLFHWDLPLALQEKNGGWLSRETAHAFGEYASNMGNHLGDRVKHWFTINEFTSFIDQGHGFSDPLYAPGNRLTRKERNQSRHHALLAHGLAVQALRSASTHLQVGIAENSRVCVPLMETEEHMDAARKAFRELNAPYLTAIMEGRYLDGYLAEEGEDAPKVSEGDFKLIGQPLDFIGLNAYTPEVVKADGGKSGFTVIPFPESYPKMGIPWLNYGPQSTYWPFRFCYELWKVNAMVVGECGTVCSDLPNENGEILDIDRILFLREYLSHLYRGVQEGLPVKAFFHWTLMDNFEWAWGFKKRFGLFYTRYPERTRIAKASAEYYRTLIRENCIP